MKADKTTIYFCDNGATYCGDHLGMTAKHTGRDRSGQKIHAVTADDAREGAKVGFEITCEMCGRGV